VNKDLHKYVNAHGDFELPNFLHHRFNSLMKSTLDLGNLACTEPNQLRAFKETVKKNFKSSWNEIAKLLEEYDFITPCTCLENEYCTICGGSRFLTNNLLNSDVIQEDYVVSLEGADEELKRKLVEGHQKALEETKGLI
jgi:hypothetical protein